MQTSSYLGPFVLVVSGLTNAHLLNFVRSNTNNSTQFNANASNDASQADAQNTSTNTSSYQLPIDLPADNNDMMSGLMDVNSMMGLYGAGNSDDLEDWGVVTKDDFSFFDEVTSRTGNCIVLEVLL